MNERKVYIHSRVQTRSRTPRFSASLKRLSEQARVGVAQIAQELGVSDYLDCCTSVSS